jgi:hypothetical protein
MKELLLLPVYCPGIGNVKSPASTGLVAVSELKSNNNSTEKMQGLVSWTVKRTVQFDAELATANVTVIPEL